MSTIDCPPVISIVDFGRMFGLTPNEIRRAMLATKIPPRPRVGRSRVIYGSDLATFEQELRELGLHPDQRDFAMHPGLRDARLAASPA